ncbi:MAG TPA: sigma-54 dependent transcriptional regulator [Kofleriaceae bacterium]
MNIGTALIADDHVEMARLLADKLAEEGWKSRIVDGGKAAIEAIASIAPDLVITDLRMADVDGLDVLDAARAADPEMPVIIMTAFGAIESAIESMKRGAWHYIVKPVRLDELVLHARRAAEHRALRRENQLLRVQTRHGMAALVGRSRAMRELYALIERIALSASAVLIRGESGTGKELVARALHEAGPRRDQPFVAINCTALPESLLESELFGHTRGAFTGATAARAGLFVEADGGTLFLDEIGDMPQALQAKLLRVLQQGEVRAVGSDETRTVDVRIVAATHQDLEQRVADGSFRQDVFYRLNVVPIVVPALRDRLDDVGVLVEHFLAIARSRNPCSPVDRVAPDVITVLGRYPWPGNVRELENLIERLVVVGATQELGIADLTALAPTIAGNQDRFSLPRDRLPKLRDVEEEYIAFVIDKCGGNKTRAADVLGIDPSTLHRRARPKR